MKVAGRPMRTIWLAEHGGTVEIIDQTRLPHELVILRLASAADAARAIRDMQVRGAPLIGAAAAYGVALAMAEDPSEKGLDRAVESLAATRPTAVNLRWALDGMRRHLSELSAEQRFAAAITRAGEIAEEDVAINRAIGEHGLRLIEDAHRRKGRRGTVQILTHCNAGWLATVDWGTALAPVYRAYDARIPVHVWVDETRPRDPREVTHIAGWTAAGERVEVRLTPADSPAANYAFDVTPARLVTALITERGVCPASREGLLRLFPERRRHAA